MHKLEVVLNKLDGVGPVDNRPLTDYLHHFVRYLFLFYKFFFLFHVTRDTWHMTHCIEIVNIVSKLQVPSPNGLGVRCFEDWEEKGQWLTHLMN